MNPFFASGGYYFTLMLAKIKNKEVRILSEAKYLSYPDPIIDGSFQIIFIRLQVVLGYFSAYFLLLKSLHILPTVTND